MIRHDYEDVHVDACTVIVKAMLEDQIPVFLGELKCPVTVKGHIVRSIITLDVREIAAVKGQDESPEV